MFGALVGRNTARASPGSKAVSVLGNSELKDCRPQQLFSACYDNRGSGTFHTICAFSGTYLGAPTFSPAPVAPKERTHPEARPRSWRSLGARRLRAHGDCFLALSLPLPPSLSVSLVHPLLRQRLVASVRVMTMVMIEVVAALR